MAYFEFIAELQAEGLDETTVNLAYEVVAATTALRASLDDLKRVVDRSLAQLVAGSLPGMGDMVVDPRSATEVALAKAKAYAAQDALQRHVKGAAGFDLVERCITAGATE